MPVLYVRLSIICLLSLALIGLAAGSDWKIQRTVRADTTIEWRCPPCGEVLPTTTELVWLAGKRWATCSDECSEEIQESPGDFMGQAID
jgi:hypothetical protein